MGTRDTLQQSRAGGHIILERVQMSGNENFRKKLKALQTDNACLSEEVSEIVASAQLEANTASMEAKSAQQKADIAQKAETAQAYADDIRTRAIKASMEGVTALVNDNYCARLHGQRLHGQRCAVIKEVIGKEGLYVIELLEGEHRGRILAMFYSNLILLNETKNKLEKLLEEHTKRPCETDDGDERGTKRPKTS